MEILLFNIAGTLTTLVGYWAVVFWHDLSRNS
jgi:hypothetical protein